MFLNALVGLIVPVCQPNWNTDVQHQTPRMPAQALCIAIALLLLATLYLIKTGLDIAAQSGLLWALTTPET